MMNLSRRDCLVGTGALSVTLLAACNSAEATDHYEVTLTDAEWRKRLSPAAYQTLRHEANERHYSIALNN